MGGLVDILAEFPEPAGKRSAINLIDDFGTTNDQAVNYNGQDIWTQSDKAFRKTLWSKVNSPTSALEFDDRTSGPVSSRCSAGSFFSSIMLRFWHVFKYLVG